MKIFNRLMGLIYPCRCTFCGKGLMPNDEEFYICDSCMLSLDFCIDKRCCTICGVPIDEEKGSLCKECFDLKKNRIIVFTKRRAAALVYDDACHDAIVNYKLARVLGGVRTFVCLMADVFNKEYGGVEFDYIVSVPPNKSRMRKIGFDQSKTLAVLLSKKIGIKYLSKALKRNRDTHRQSSLSRDERRKNLKGVFSAAKNSETYKDKVFLLIDDVSTTGTTLNECAKALKVAGAEAVYCLTIAKTSLHKN